MKRRDPQLLRNIVNGDMLSQYIGKNVSISGTVIDVNSNGTGFDIRTVDDCTVKIALKRPYRDLLEGHVEIHGVAQTKNLINCDEILQFPNDSDFDYAAHNKLCQLLPQVPDMWATTL